MVTNKSKDSSPARGLIKKIPFFPFPSRGMGRDQPDPTLILEGSRRTHPSRRIQGQDYPTTALQELEERVKGNNTHTSKQLCC